jgi:hypothetical protein
MRNTAALVGKAVNLFSRPKAMLIKPSPPMIDPIQSRFLIFIFL